MDIASAFTGLCRKYARHMRLRLNGMPDDFTTFAIVALSREIFLVPEDYPIGADNAQ